MPRLNHFTVEEDCSLWLFVLQNLRERQWLSDKVKGNKCWEIYKREKRVDRSVQSLQTRYCRIEKDLYQYPLAKEDLLYLYKSLMIPMDPVHVKPALEEKFNCTISLRNRNWTVRGYTFLDNAMEKEKERETPRRRNMNKTVRIPTKALPEAIQQEGLPNENSFDLTGNFDDFMRKLGRRDSNTRKELNKYHTELKEKGVPFTRMVTNFKKLPNQCQVDNIGSASTSPIKKRSHNQIADQNDSSPKLKAYKGLMQQIYPKRYTPELEKRGALRQEELSPGSQNGGLPAVDEVEIAPNSHTRNDIGTARMTFKELKESTIKKLTEILHGNQVLVNRFEKKISDSSKNQDIYLKNSLCLLTVLRLPTVQMHFLRKKQPELDLHNLNLLNVAPILKGFEKEWHEKFSKNDRFEATSHLWDRVWKQSGKRITFKLALWQDVRSVEQKAFSFATNENAYRDRLENSIKSIAESFLS